MGALVHPSRLLEGIDRAFRQRPDGAGIFQQRRAVLHFQQYPRRTGKNRSGPETLSRRRQAQKVGRIAETAAATAATAAESAESAESIRAVAAPKPVLSAAAKFVLSKPVVTKAKLANAGATTTGCVRTARKRKGVPGNSSGPGNDAGRSRTPAGRAEGQ